VAGNRSESLPFDHAKAMPDRIRTGIFQREIPEKSEIYGLRGTNDTFVERKFHKTGLFAHISLSAPFTRDHFEARREEVTRRIE